MSHNRKRVALFGGTFDPVHLGHLQSAEKIHSSLALDETYLVPLAAPVHKAAPLASDEERLQCLRLALQSYPGLQIETCELERQGSSYTVDTLTYLREKKPDDIFYWVMGMDAYLSFENWKQPEEILALANLLVLNRPGYEHKKAPYDEYICELSEFTDKDSGAIFFVEMEEFDISSTQLREQLRENKADKSLLNYMPQQVLNYIQKENIYKKQREIMKVEELKDKIVDALEDIKGIDITAFPVGEMTSVADYLIVASGSSDRQVKSLANNVQVKLKEHDVRPLGVEGEREGQWVLIDYADILVHIMVPEMRDFYNLEKLWEQRPSTAEQS